MRNMGGTPPSSFLYKMGVFPHPTWVKIGRGIRYGNFFPPNGSWKGTSFSSASVQNNTLKSSLDGFGQGVRVGRGSGWV